jgi:hypothetical protein
VPSSLWRRRHFHRRAFPLSPPPKRLLTNLRAKHVAFESCHQRPRRARAGSVCLGPRSSSEPVDWDQNRPILAAPNSSSCQAVAMRSPRLHSSGDALGLAGSDVEQAARCRPPSQEDPTHYLAKGAREANEETSEPAGTLQRYKDMTEVVPGVFVEPGNGFISSATRRSCLLGGQWWQDDPLAVTACVNACLGRCRGPRRAEHIWQGKARIAHRGNVP